MFLLLSLMAAPPVAIDVTGMAPQLAIVRRDAAARGWQISCEGRSGEEGVVRLNVPPGTPAQAIEAHFDPNHHFGSQLRYYYAGDILPARCDGESAVGSSSSPVRVLAIGLRGDLAPLAEIARACGFSQAALREVRQEDLLAGQASPHQDWLALDPGEGAGARSGPLICFIQLGVRPLVSRQH